MTEDLLDFLACPDCGAALTLAIEACDGAEILSGRLSCGQCLEVFPIRGGVPRFVQVADDVQRATAENFGAQWLAFDHVSPHHVEQFRDWIAPVEPEFLRGKVILEGGCGKGRHTRLAAEWGARAVVGVDLSNAVDAAYRNTRDCANVHIIQADIYRLPLKPAFDYAFSVGVLHHLPDPRDGFLALASKLRPGGSISAWVYGRENNDWIVKFINPLRVHLTSRLPFRALSALSYPAAAMLFVVLKLVYRTPLGRRMFYADYLGYIAGFPFREIHNIVHDHLTAPVAEYIRREEFAAWFDAADAREVGIHWHNRNSWRGFGRVGAESNGDRESN